MVDGRGNGSGTEESDHGSPLGVDSSLSKGSSGEHVDCEDVGEQNCLVEERAGEAGGGVVVI